MSARGSGFPIMAYRWVILGIVYLAFLAFAVVFQSIPPILPLMIADLGLSHTEAGLLISLFALPGVFLSIPIGIATDLYGPKNLMILCLISMVIGTMIVAAGQSFSILALGRLVAGAGGVTLFVVGAQLVSIWFAGDGLGIAVGIYSTCVPVGTILSLTTLGGIGAAFGWQVPVLISAGLSIVALLVLLVFYKPFPLVAGQQSEQRQQVSISKVLSMGLPIWLVGFIWMLFNASVISFLTFAPDFFLASGYSLEVAGFLTSFVMLLSPPLAPVVGYLLDKFRHEELFIIAGNILVAFSIFLVPTESTSLILLLVLLGLGTVLVPSPVFALPPRILPPEQIGTGYGIVSTSLNFGIVAGPYLSGVVRDATGYYLLSFYLMASFAVLGVIVSVILYVMRNRSRGILG